MPTLVKCKSAEAAAFQCNNIYFHICICVCKCVSTVIRNGKQTNARQISDESRAG